MGRILTAASLAALLSGTALLVASIARGAARLYLVLFVVPVITGGSLEFVGGVALVFAGVAGLFLALVPVTVEDEDEPGAERPPKASGAPSTRGASGGLILLGPIPIFFGAARPATRRAYLVALLVAVGLFVLVLALAVGL